MISKNIKNEELVRIYNNATATEIVDGRRKLLNEDVLRGIIKIFCETYLRDNKDRPLKLRPSQMEMVVSALTQKKLIVLAPRGCGKSYCIGVAIVLRLFFLREREEVVLIAPTNKQAKRVFKYVNDFLMGHPDLKRLVKTVRQANPAQITMFGTSTVSCVPVSKNDHGENVRGMHPTFCVVDESGFIPDDIFIPNVEPIVVANEASFINITTPGSRENHVYKYLFDPKMGKRWSRIKFTYRDVMDQGDAYEPAYPINSETGKSEIDEIIEEWGEESGFFQREYMCEFDTDNSNIFTETTFQKAFYDLKEFQYGSDGAYHVMTIDYGRKHNSTAWCLWQLKARESDGKSVASLVDIHEIIPKAGGYTPKAIRTDILEYVQKNKVKAVVIDATAFGDSFAQDLKDHIYMNTPGIVVYDFIFSSNKSDWYYKYKYLMNDARVKIPKPSSLSDNRQANSVAKLVHQHKVLVANISERSGKTLITKPRHERDDLADAAMLITYFLEKNPSTSIEIELDTANNITRTRPNAREIVTPTRLSRYDNFKNPGMY